MQTDPKHYQENIQPDEIQFIHKPPTPILPGTLSELLYDEWGGLNFEYRHYQQGIHERFGPIVLSIQAGSGNYCDPRDTYLPNLGDYEHVEIAMFDLREFSPPSKYGNPDFSPRGDWTDPGRLGIEGFEEWLDVEFDQVGGYVPWEVVNALRFELAVHYGGTSDLTLYDNNRNAQGFTATEFDLYQKAGPVAVEVYRAQGCPDDFQWGEE